jgi:hypothetical protein
MRSEPDIISSETKEKIAKCKVSVCNRTALLCPGHAVEEPPVLYNSRLLERLCYNNRIGRVLACNSEARNVYKILVGKP